MSVGELAENIKDEVFIKLDEIYSHRKDREGLVSAQNQLITNLQKVINKWVEEQKKFDKRIKQKEQKHKSTEDFSDFLGKNFEKDRAEFNERTKPLRYIPRRRLEIIFD